ncbi:MAG TPA: MMPL family transporter [Verrucomicrobiae bacterium]|nr:MMPL family transporter [Verrucomicrobiae bacterium]
MATERPSLATRLLLWLADAICRHRPWFGWPHLVLSLLGLYVTLVNPQLKFRTERNALVGGDKQYHRIFMEFRKEFPSEDDIVVVVESEQLEKNRQFVERLGAKLEAETNLFAHVFYKGGLKMMGRKALLFVPEPDLIELRKTLQDFRPFLQQFTRATNLLTLINLVNRQIAGAREEDNAENQSLIRALPALERILDQATDGLLRSGVPPSPGLAALFGSGQKAESQLYITFGDGRIYLVSAQAASAKHRSDTLKRLRQLVSETEAEVPGLNVGVTGEPVLEFDEMLQSQKDTTVATVVSLILVALIFIYGYQETGRPLKATLCLLVGIIYTLAFTTLTVGHLNILTITFVPILIGLAIDFGVHLITRYEEELRHGRSQRVALEKAVVNTGMGVFTGAFTTAGAFFAMVFTDFNGIREMGVICGGGLMVSLIPMMTLLPVLLLRGRQNLLDHQLGPVLESKAAVETDRRARIENVWLRRPGWVILLITVISLLCIPPSRRVGFDYNLLHMQSRGLPAVVFQDKLIHSSTRSVLFGAIVATNLVQATNLIAILTNLPTVSTVDSMAPYLVQDPGPKLGLLRDIKQIASEIHFLPVDPAPVDVKELDGSLFGLHGYLKLIASKVENDPKLHEQVMSLRQSVSALRQRLLLDERAPTADKLARFQQALFNDVRDTFTTIQEQDDSGSLKAADLPETLRQRFIGVTGKYLLQVYPKRNVWDRKQQAAFVADLRTVDPLATGTPVQLLEYTTLLKESYEQAALYSLAAIAILVLIHFRRISCVFMSLLPVALGFLWMVGIMGLLGISFNPANIMTLPLVIGIGVTNGIHILNRFAEEQHPSILARSTGKAVLVSGLTTIAGFGSLIAAKHRGIESLGIIMATGTATAMLIGLTLLPAILNVLYQRGWSLKKNPAR